MAFCFRLLLLICLVASTARAESHTHAGLLLSHETARAGETVLAGVDLKMDPPWHTYWRNPGDSGGQIEISWELPDGISAGTIQWPVPRKHLFDDLATYIYENEIVLFVPLNISAAVKPGPQKIKAKVSWIECDIACIMGDTEVSADLVIGNENKKTADATLEAAQKTLPRDGSKIGARAFWGKTLKNPGLDEETRLLIIEWPTTNAIEPEFFSYETQGYDVLAVTEVLSNEGGRVRLQKGVKKIDGDWPKEISGLLVENVSAGQDSVAYEVKLSINAQQSSAPAEKIKAISQTTPAPVTGNFLLGKLLAAFLGGLILNIMPCVLPVIALKILGFVQQSKESPQHVFKLGLVYTAGVLLSFFVLAAVIIAFQKAGGAASWGMQMQYPHYRLALMVVALLVALNLFGFFEINLGGRAMQTAGDLSAKEGSAGAFFNGVLATALATPCTAPFLAPAVGFAFAQPPHVIVLLFFAIGLGLASPYLLLSWKPQWLKFLPKPGAWMDKFKKIMGIPMLATAVWLFSLTSSSFGQNGALGLGIFAVCLAIFTWIWGKFIQRSAKNKSTAAIIALVILAAGYLYGLENQAKWRRPQQVSVKIEKAKDDEISWEPWSPEAVEKARAEGRVIFVDFTAKWCLTCKANKRSSIEIDSVRKKLKEVNAVALLADNTDPDPRIAAELQKFDRAGVPMVLVYPRDASKPPTVLPTLLTPGTVLDALTEAAK